MFRNERNTELVNCLLADYEKKGMDAFVFEWEGTRVPTIVTFPDGSERTVEYMRDGIFLFTDYSNAVYERLVDYYPQQPQIVLVAYHPAE